MKEANLLEKILINHGRIINHQLLKTELSGYKNINKKINSLVKNRWLVNLKKSLYYITKLGSRGYISISNYIIANAIGEKSFVSFEAALQFHRLFDQGIRKYRSISLKQYLAKDLENIRYEYIKVSAKSYFGFYEVAVDGGLAKIALKERALLDLLEYQRTISSTSLVLEKLSNNFEEFDQEILLKYLKSYSKVTKKTIGFFFDLLDKNSKEVAKQLIKDQSVSKLTTNSTKYSKKWRLYYDSILEKQI